MLLPNQSSINEMRVPNSSKEEDEKILITGNPTPLTSHSLSLALGFSQQQRGKKEVKKKRRRLGKISFT